MLFILNHAQNLMDNTHECKCVCVCVPVCLCDIRARSSLTSLQSLLLHFILQIQLLLQYFILSHVTEPGPLLLHCVYFVHTLVYTCTLYTQVVCLCASVMYGKHFCKGPFLYTQRLVPVWFKRHRPGWVLRSAEVCLTYLTPSLTSFMQPLLLFVNHTKALD